MTKKRSYRRYSPEFKREAKYDFEWTHGILESKFTRFSRSANPNVFIYYGDGLKLQNGFGAWQIHTYQCTFNADTEQAKSVAVSPGRLK
jgi:hypothetical protein